MEKEFRSIDPSNRLPMRFNLVSADSAPNCLGRFPAIKFLAGVVRVRVRVGVRVRVRVRVRVSGE